MTHLTIRNVSRELAEALEAERLSRGASLNRTVLDLLARSLGVAPPIDNGLARHAGTWTDEEADQFAASIADLDPVDPDLWA